MYKSRQTRTQPRKDELDRLLATHLSFEMNRFRLGRMLWQSQEHHGPTLDMLRESCLIHMRLLLDFFYPRRKPETSPFKDVFVTDYIPKKEWSVKLKALLKPMPSWVKDYRKKLDWQLAHLTMKRTDLEIEHPWVVWDVAQPFEHLEKLIDEFLAALPPERRKLYDEGRGWPGSQSSPITL